MDRNLALAARFVVGLTWLYEGLWLKLLKHDPMELRVIANVFAPVRVAPLNLLFAVGCGEVMLAFGVLIGWSPRFLAGVQVLLLLAMDSTGIALGKGALADPAGLIIKNLPFLLCILFVGLYDGSPAKPTKRAPTPRAKRKPSAE
jgi:hypothetical protein